MQQIKDGTGQLDDAAGEPEPENKPCPVTHRVQRLQAILSVVKAAAEIGIVSTLVEPWIRNELDALVDDLLSAPEPGGAA